MHGTVFRFQDDLLKTLALEQEDFENIHVRVEIFSGSTIMRVSMSTTSATGEVLQRSKEIVDRFQPGASLGASASYLPPF